MLNIISRSSSPSHVKSIQLQNIIVVLLPWFLITCWDNQYSTWRVTASSRGARVVPGQCCWSPQQGWVGDPRWASGSSWRSWASLAFLCLPLSAISCGLIHYFVQFFVQYSLRFLLAFMCFFGWALQESIPSYVDILDFFLWWILLTPLQNYPIAMIIHHRFDSPIRTRICQLLIV